MLNIAIQVETARIVIYGWQHEISQFGIDLEYKTCLTYVLISSNVPRPLGAAYVLILPTEVEQEQRHSGNREREAVVVGAGLCDGEGERAYTVYDPILCRERYLKLFKRF